MSRNIWTLISVALVVSAVMAAQASATTIILDTFTRPATGTDPLAGSSPDIDTTAEAHTWSVRDDPSDAITNGSVAQLASTSPVALIPFAFSDTPTNSLVTLSADLTMTDIVSPNFWTAFGFTTGGAPSENGAPMALLTAQGQASAFAGPGTNNFFAGTPAGSGTSSSANLALTYNQLTNVASFYVNGTLEGSITYLTPPTITDVGIQLLSGGTATFDNLTVSAELVPEPASLMLLTVGGAALLRRRRRA